MLETKTPWQQFEISADQTHHRINQEPAYPKRFLSVLKFHEPGLAPAKDASGAFHINPLGEPVYSHRFLQTFGFYEGLAAVQDTSGWHHILTDGTSLYSDRFAWCGNYQQGLCPVRDGNGSFFHLNREGKRPYSHTFRYVGDFRDGFAVVQNGEGLHTHIDAQGNLLHGKWFMDLDIYHKGYARAKDQQGWFHIDLRGLAIYSQRYQSIEHFYNGIARVETKLGALHLINEKGEKTGILREALEDEFHQVSGELVSYWRFYTLQAAVELQVFDYLPNTTPQIAGFINLPVSSAFKLLRALQEMGFVEADKNGWLCSSKGAFLRSDHLSTLKHASYLWKEEHMICWRHITYSLKTTSPAFNHLFGKGWFDWLKDHPEKNQQYHNALSIYARRDYHAFCSCVDLTCHRSLLDVGGSTGALLTHILNANPHLQGILLDLPDVIQLVQVPSHLEGRMQCLSASFFEDWPPIKTESAVLSRVLHDWSDTESLRILRKVHATLSDHPDNRLYIIEKVQDAGSAHGSLLDLNMLIMTGGVERTLKDFEHLLKQAGFVLEKTRPLNSVSSILIAKKIN